MRTPELALAFFVAVAASPALAQYKWVGPGGAITYSDLPPPPGITAVKLGEAAPPAAGDTVPAELRAAASKHPVTLYTTSNCAPCQQARALLSKRGVPFTEKTVTTQNDADAFKRVGFNDNSFPSVSVGRQRTVGFDAGEYDRLLDAAGYPSKSTLPPTYKQAPATGLAAATATKAAEGANDAGGVIGSEPSATASAEGSGAPAVRQRGPAPRADGSAVAPPPRNSTALRF